MKAWWICLVLCGLVCYGQLSEWVSPEIAARMEENRQLRRGGCKMFEDCIIAVGTANYHPDIAMLAQSVAHANARAEMAGLLQGYHVKATDTVEEDITSGNEHSSVQTRSVSEVTSTIERFRQAAIRPGGEWLSADGKTLFVCLYSLTPDTPSKFQTDSQIPDFVQDWEFDNPEWEALFRGAQGILRGGATLVCDDYGEQFLLVVSTCPVSESFHTRRMHLHSRALATAVTYTNGTILSDMRYLRESMQSMESDSGDQDSDMQITIRHIQKRFATGEIKMQDAGSWTIHNGQTACAAFLLRVSDLENETHEVVLQNAESSDETIEIDLDDSAAAKLLLKELPRAIVQETKEQIILELPENSPLFGKNETEILIADNLVMPIPFPVPQPQQNVIVLWQPQRLPARFCRPQRHCHMVYRRQPRIIHHPVRRTFLPARCYRPHPPRRMHPGLPPQHRPPKPILLRRGRHAPSPHHAPRTHAPRSPRFRVRHPARRK